MFRRAVSRFTLLAVITLFGVSAVLFSQDSNHRGRKYKAPPPTSRVDVTILRHDDGKPIENAAVIFQLVGDKGNMELKTNEDGKTMIDVLPTGSKVLLQVIAKGYQTYGHEYSVDKASMAIEVKLKRPGSQYSIYGKDGDASNKDKQDSSKPDAAKPQSN